MLIGEKQMNKPSEDEVPQKSLGDLGHTASKALISSIPVLGGSLAELFDALIAPPFEKRRNEWLEDLFDRLKRLEQKLEQFEYRTAFENADFFSTFLQATRHAMVNHNEENLRALRNAVLNSALPQAPEDVRQKIFVEWAGEFTAWHIRILRLFADEPWRIPVLDLGDSSWWLIDMASNELVKLIEEKYPETGGSIHLCLQIVGDLHTRRLLTNQVPEDGVVRMESRPVLSPVAEEFLAFITSPIDDEQ